MPLYKVFDCKTEDWTENVLCSADGEFYTYDKKHKKCSYIPNGAIRFFVCRFAGIVKNGECLYEGNIVKMDDGKIGVIGYANTHLCFVVNCGKGDLRIFRKAETIEVIGHIFKDAVPEELEVSLGL